MNEKQNIFVEIPGGAELSPWAVKITHVRPAPVIKPNSDAFAVDWQLEGGAGAATSSETNLAGWRQHIAGGQTNGRRRSTSSFGPPRRKLNK